ncbi:MAG: hypothetical protein KKA81_13425 [Bacteroidetes bacterium]|nr:hypothetical protein [Bacteroidota bacterium]
MIKFRATILFIPGLMMTLFTLALCFPASIMAQQQGYGDISFGIPSIAMLDLEPTALSNIVLVVMAPTEAGLPVSTQSASNSQLWLNYSSSLPTGGLSRSIMVQITAGTLPQGLELNLNTAPFAGSGSGTFGSTSGEIAVNYSPQRIISGIGRCFTGNGQNNGHNLTYSLSVIDFSKLDLESSTAIQITYTITDD